jgi:hypothetical protein
MGAFGFVTRHVSVKIMAFMKWKCEEVLSQHIISYKDDSQPKIWWMNVVLCTPILAIPRVWNKIFLLISKFSKMGFVNLKCYALMSHGF